VSIITDHTTSMGASILTWAFGVRFIARSCLLCGSLRFAHDRQAVEAPMWHEMFVEQIPIAEKVLRTVLVYALIAVLFRLTGKRGLANLNTFDFIVIFLLSNVVQNAVIGNDNSLLGGMVGAVTLVAVNAGVNRLTAMSPTAERLFEAVPR